jgi:nitrate/nitrite transporter NarK
LQQRTGALRQVITLLLSITAGTAVLLWFVLPATTMSPAAKPGFDLRGVARVVRMPAVWLQAAIILCAYVGFRAVDDFSLYANEVLGVNEVDAASLGTVSLWVRPVAAIAAGYLADRVGAGRMTLLSFALIATGSLILAAGVISAGLYALFVLTVVVASLGIFALRGLYFAIMKEGRIPLPVTGSAVGIVSLVGYTPDVFMGPLMGWLLDRSPGAAGHQHVFVVAAAFALLGMSASVLFQRVTRRQRAEN